jgi:multidrug efflux pump
VSAAEGASFESNAANLKKIEDILLPYLETGEMKRVIVRTPGFGGTAGVAVVGAADWQDRKRSTFDLMGEVSGKLAEIPDVRAFAIMRSSLGGRGLGRPVQFVLQGNTYEELVRYRNILMQKAAENPNLIRLDSDYKETLPQLLINIDRDRAADLGVSIGDIGSTLETMLGQRRVSTYLDRGQEYDVIMEGKAEDFRSPQSIDNLYVRSQRSNQLIPLSNLLSVSEQATSATLNRYNRARSITISANLAPGYALGDALEYLRNIALTELPDEVST